MKIKGKDLLMLIPLVLMIVGIALFTYLMCVSIDDLIK